MTEPSHRRGMPGGTPPPSVVCPEVTLLYDDDLYLFNEGSHVRLYEKLGAHPLVVDGNTGTYFAVWAPNARQVSVMGTSTTGIPGVTRCIQEGSQASGRASFRVSAMA